MKINLVPYNLQNYEEAQEICSVIQKYFSHSPWPTTPEKIMVSEAVYFRAFLNKLQIGMTGYKLKTPTLAETVKTTVFQQYQGQGLGKLLSQSIEEECRSLGVKKVMTTVFYFNHKMLSIKMQQGYIIEGYHRDHEAPEFHEYSLGKKLS
jgi:GNAT superfamily N-acetyltransferase